jgi:hypothetical protein
VIGGLCLRGEGGAGGDCGSHHAGIYTGFWTSGTARPRADFDGPASAVDSVTEAERDIAVASDDGSC